MKKVIFMLISTLLICTAVNAQYRINKTKYDFHNYSPQDDDPYNPPLCGLTSFLIPGLGQTLSGEFIRGLGYLCGCIGCTTVSVAGFASFAYNLDTDEHEHKEPNVGKAIVGLGISVIGAICTICIDLDSVVDAIRVAKVNNLAFRDKHKTSFNLQIQPYVNTTSYSQTKSIPAGISLKIRF